MSSIAIGIFFKKTFYSLLFGATFFCYFSEMNAQSSKIKTSHLSMTEFEYNGEFIEHKQQIFCSVGTTITFSSKVLPVFYKKNSKSEKIFPSYLYTSWKTFDITDSESSKRKQIPLLNQTIFQTLFSSLTVHQNKVLSFSEGFAQPSFTMSFDLPGTYIISLEAIKITPILKQFIQQFKNLDIFKIFPSARRNLIVNVMSIIGLNAIKNKNPLEENIQHGGIYEEGAVQKVYLQAVPFFSIQQTDGFSPSIIWSVDPKKAGKIKKEINSPLVGIFQHSKGYSGEVTILARCGLKDWGATFEFEIQSTFTIEGEREFFCSGDSSETLFFIFLENSNPKSNLFKWKCSPSKAGVLIDDLGLINRFYNNPHYVSLSYGDISISAVLKTPE